MLNIRAAETLALRIWQRGAACICPHKNTAHLGGAVPDSVWLQGDLEMVRRCDAVVCVENWRSSTGAREEVAFAKLIGIPVFLSFADFATWMDRVLGLNSL